MARFHNIDRAAFSSGYIGYSNGTWRISKKESGQWCAVRSIPIQGQLNYFECRTLAQVSAKLEKETQALSLARFAAQK
jgi:hypothetical protein